MDETVKTVTPEVPDTSDRDSLRDWLARRFISQPQRAAQAAAAAESLFAGIDQLAALGLTWVAHETLPDAVLGEEYPKMLYHEKQAAVIVDSRAEEERLGPGWFTHPSREEGTEAGPGSQKPAKMQPKAAQAAPAVPSFTATA